MHVPRDFNTLTKEGEIKRERERGEEQDSENTTKLHRITLSSTKGKMTKKIRIRKNNCYSLRDLLHGREKSRANITIQLIDDAKTLKEENEEKLVGSSYGRTLIFNLR